MILNINLTPNMLIVNANSGSHYLYKTTSSSGPLILIETASWLSQ